MADAIHTIQWKLNCNCTLLELFKLMLKLKLMQLRFQDFRITLDNTRPNHEPTELNLDWKLTGVFCPLCWLVDRHLSCLLGNKFDHGAESIMPTLLNLVPNSAKIMATSGMAAIRIILRVRARPPGLKTPP